EPQVKHREKFEIDLPDQRWWTLAHIIFNKKPSLANMLESSFGISFDKPTSQNPISDPVKKISFWGYEDSGDKLKKTLEVMREDQEQTKYFSKQAVREIARQINETGSYERKTPAVQASSSSAAEFN